MIKCPVCNEGELIESENLIKCSNQSSENENGSWVETGTCTFKVFKSALSRFGGDEITLDFIKNLIENNGKLEVNLVSKAGNPYVKDALLSEKYGVSIDFNSHKNE